MPADPLEARYPELEKLIVGACAIPLLETSFVPQGISWISRELVAMAFYDYEKKSPSRLAIVDFATGKLLHRFDLFTASGQPYTGHASGIATHEGSLWLTGRQHLHAFDLEDVLRGGCSEILARSGFAVDANGSFLSSADGLLWTGDFTRRVTAKQEVAGAKIYKAPAHHQHGKLRAWAAGYRVTKDRLPAGTAKYRVNGVEVHAPERVVFLPDLVQGFAICGDHVVLSRSYGPSDSGLELYRPPFADEPVRVEIPGGSVLGHMLEERHPVKTIPMPAGSQDLSWDGERLVTTFEGANATYRARWTTKGAGIEGRALAFMHRQPW